MTNGYEVIFENGTSTTGTTVDVLIGAVRFRRETIYQVWHHTREQKSFRMQHKLLCHQPLSFPELERLLRNYGASYM